MDNEIVQQILNTLRTAIVTLEDLEDDIKSKDVISTETGIEIVYDLDTDDISVVLDQAIDQLNSLRNGIA